MKLIIDAQISPAIAAWINRSFNDIQAISARSVKLQYAKDSEILTSTLLEVKNLIDKDEAIVEISDV